MVGIESIRYFDVLFVVDDKDYSKVYLNRMLEALRTVTPPLNIGKECILDTWNEKVNIRAEEVILLAEHPTGYILDSLTQWIDQLRNRRNQPSKIILINHACQNQDLKIKNVQIVNVDDLYIVYKFWPDVLRFLFITRKNARKVHLFLKTDIEADATSPWLVGKYFLSLKRCLDEFNIEQTENREAASTSVIAVTQSFARSSGVQVQELLAGSPNPYHTTHVLTTKAGDIVREVEQLRTSVHECQDMLLYVLWTLVDAECLQTKRNVPSVPFDRNMTHALGNSESYELLWWFVFVFVLLFNLPAYLAYCCSPLTPLVLYIILYNDIRKIKFFYTSNIIFTIMSAILTGLAAKCKINIPIESFILAMVYFLLVQTIVNYFLIRNEFLYCDNSSNPYGLLRLAKYIWKEKCTLKSTTCGIDVWSVLEAFMTVIGVCNVSLSILLRTIFTLLLLFNILVSLLSNETGPSFYAVHFYYSIALAVVIWPLYVASVLSVEYACVIYFC